MTKDKYKPPKPTASDGAHAAARAGISGLPAVGGLGVELFNSIVSIPLERRRDEWRESVGQGLSELEDRVDDLSLDHLQDNEEFITAVTHASRAALASHQEDKLRALRNAVLNVAIGRSPEEDLQLIFLNLIDALTPWHLRLMRYGQNPRAYGEAKGIKYPSWSAGGPSNVLVATFPELEGNRAFYDQLVRDLQIRGLFGTTNLHMTMTESGMFGKLTTEMGDAFVNFIESPLSRPE